MKLLTLLLALILIAAFAKHRYFSFRAQKPEHYAESSPAFSLTEHLAGEILSEGLIFGPDGRMTNSFTARMYGQWDGNRGTLREEFTYSNGKQQSREWQLTLGPGNSFTATAADIVGEARGEVSGATVRMDYQIQLPQEAGGHVLTATDWLYLTENGVILNKSEMTKYGIKAVELIATMRPAATK